jgi:DNA (cytosine-5)-methyltransferase 1
MGSVNLKYGSVCSGIEAATVAWEPLGWTPAYFAEIDRDASAVLAARFPGVANLGDFTEIDGNHSIDLLVGGTPCQSFSVAGLRAGLDDARGNLALGFLQLARRERPRWILWENVPGVLSSTSPGPPGAVPPPPPVEMGRAGQEMETEEEREQEEVYAFNCFLAGLSELGYGWAYRVLDAQFFGVPQRRRRVFVVGYLGDWRPPAAVLFERESLRGNPASRRKARKGTPAGTEGGASGGNLTASPLSASDGRRCGGGTRGDAGDNVVPCLANALSSRNTRLDNSDNFVPVVASGSDDGAGHHGHSSPRGDGTDNLIPFDTTQITSAANRSAPQPGDPCHPLAATGHAPAVAFSCKDYGGDAGEVAPTLRAMPHDSSHANGGGQVAVAVDLQNTRIGGDVIGTLDTTTPSRGGGQAVAVLPILEVGARQGSGDCGVGIGDAGDPMVTLQASKKHGIAVKSPNVYQCHGSNVGPMGTLRATESVPGGVPFTAGPSAFHATQDPISGDVCPSLPTHKGSIGVAGAGMTVRRLTPRECERLQGFPDDWTLVERNGKPMPDSARYRMIGNSMAVVVMRWLGCRIKMFEGLLAETREAETCARS